MNLYPKIYGPYKRHTEGPLKNKLIHGDWTLEEFALLQDLNWHWTEKIDGTNVRVGWDGHSVRFGGRTDNAQMPTTLLAHLQDAFPEELFEQRFGDQEVTLYGEGHGPKIQKVGALYGDEVSFTLFDVRVGKWWLKPGDVRGVAESLGVHHVFQFPEMRPWEAMEIVGQGLGSSFGGFLAEGLVGRAPGGLLTRSGERIMMKVKTVDFFQQGHVA